MDMQETNHANHVVINKNQHEPVTKLKTSVVVLFLFFVGSLIFAVATLSIAWVFIATALGVVLLFVPWWEARQAKLAKPNVEKLVVCPRCKMQAPAIAIQDEPGGMWGIFECKTCKMQFKKFLI
jgi:hypothetical protein